MAREVLNLAREYTQKVETVYLNKIKEEIQRYEDCGCNACSVKKHNLKLYLWSEEERMFIDCGDGEEQWIKSLKKRHEGKA